MDNINLEDSFESETPDYSQIFLDTLQKEGHKVMSREAYFVLLRYATMVAYNGMKEHSFTLPKHNRLKYWQIEKISFTFTSIQRSTMPIVIKFEKELECKTRFDMILEHIANEIEYSKIFESEVPEIEIESTIPELTPKQAQQIAYLHELGVIEFLKKRIRSNSPSTIAHYLAVILGVQQHSIKNPLVRLETGGIDEKCFVIAKDFIRKRKNPLVPLPSIKFDNDIED